MLGTLRQRPSFYCLHLLEYHGEDLAVNGCRRIALVLLFIMFLVPFSTMIVNESFTGLHSEFLLHNQDHQKITAIEQTSNITADWTQACSSVIVTGNATKDGRAILMKNRDWLDQPMNIPVYVPATPSTYAYVGVNTNTMGINEKGLAVMNTYLPALAGADLPTGNLILNQKILENFESVSEVAHALNNSYSLIGPVYRSYSGDVATCVGIIDRFGTGAFFEISNTKAYVQYIVDGYDSRANHPRIFPTISTGPNGRDQYLLDALDIVYAENGYISPEHVMQNVSRYVHHKELGSANFSIDGEACNPTTVATMVAVSGDERYDGMLNCMWTACGPNPLVGVFVPSMVCAEDVPESIEDLWSHTIDKFVSARGLPPTSEGLLYPARVREVQKYAFFAENYTVDSYDHLMSSVPEGLSDNQIRNTISEFIEAMCNYASEIFIEETTNVEIPASISFPDPSSIVTTSTQPTSPTSTSTTDNPTSPTSAPSEPLFDEQLVTLAIGLVAGFTIVVIMGLIMRRFT